MLVSKARIDRHDQNLIHVLENFFKRFPRRCRIDDNTDALPKRLHALHRAMQIVVAFPVDKKRIGAGGCKFGEETIRVRDHQMGFQQPPARREARALASSTGLRHSQLQGLVRFRKRHDSFHVPKVVRGRLALDVPVHRVLEQDGANNSLTGEAWGW
jgi:hypothetical protein